MIRRSLLGSLLLLSLLVRPTLVRADDRKPEEDGALRLFHVHAIVSGRCDQRGERLGLVRPDEVSDAERPLFGAQAEEALSAVGSVDELIELLKNEVDPGSWTSVSGADVRSLGAGTLLVRNLPAVQVGIGAALKRHEDRWLRSIVVEVQAVRLPANPGSLSPEALAALATAPERGPGLSLTLLPGQRVTGFAGKQVAYVGDYDVEVAQKARISDPIVLVANVGLCADVRAVPTLTGDRVLLGLDGRLTQLVELPAVPAGESRKVETPVLASTTVRAVRELPSGAWTLLDGAAAGSGSGWAFLVRARVAARTSGPASPGIPLPGLESAGIGRFERQVYDVDQLTLPIRNVNLPLPTLTPSNYTPPEPPEMLEPAPALQPDLLVELLRACVAPDSWSREGASLEVRTSTLIARAPEGVLQAIARVLGTLKRELLWSVEVDAEVLTLDERVSLGAEGLLSDEAQQTLAQALAAGAATTLDRVRLTSMHGARNALRSGRERAYLMDYDVEIAEDATISNPILQHVFAGVVLDIQPALSSTGDSATLAVRFSRTALEEPVRSFESTAGPIQAPVLRVFSLRTDVDVPFGRTAMVGSASEGGSRTVLLLTPRLRRGGD